MREPDRHRPNNGGKSSPNKFLLLKGNERTDPADTEWISRLIAKIVRFVAITGSILGETVVLNGCRGQKLMLHTVAGDG